MVIQAIRDIEMRMRLVEAVPDSVIDRIGRAADGTSGVKWWAAVLTSGFAIEAIMAAASLHYTARLEAWRAGEE